MKKCPHNKQKYYCRMCKGGSFCIHDKQKSQCGACKGSQICEHLRQKSKCGVCKGSQICQHLRQKSQCVDCGGTQICEHLRQKSQCVDCGGTQICEHLKQKSICGVCKGTQICEHLKQKRYCRACKGSQICDHFKQMKYCKICGGSQLCKSSWCETQVTKKYEGYCQYCFINLFPDKSISRNYKIKEKAINEFTMNSFPQFMWLTRNKILHSEFSKKEYELVIDLLHQVIVIEVGENQQEYSCWNKNLLELYQDIRYRKLIFIKFNPDSYINKNKETIKSCWHSNKQGITVIGKKQKFLWQDRLNTLKEIINYWIYNEPSKNIEVIELYYDKI